MSELTPVSPSQINTYLLCPRRWGWDKIAGHREPTTPAQQFGTDTHLELENFYVKKVTPNQLTAPGRLAAKGLHLIPPMHHPSAVVEGKFHFDLDGIRYNGIKDLVYEDGKHKLDVIHDHKTTSSPDWVKTYDDLQDDPQAIIYAHDYFLTYPEAEQVILRWLYLFTKGNREPVIVQAFLDREFVEKQFRILIVPVAKLIAHAKENITDPLDLPYRVQACSAFHKPCPHLDRCNLSVTERCLPLMSNESSNGSVKSPAELLKQLEAAIPSPSPVEINPSPVQPEVAAPSPAASVEINPPPVPLPADHPLYGVVMADPNPVAPEGMPPAPIAAPRAPKWEGDDSPGGTSLTLSPAPKAVGFTPLSKIAAPSPAASVEYAPPPAPVVEPEAPPMPTVQGDEKPKKTRRRRRTKAEMAEARGTAAVVESKEPPLEVEGRISEELRAAILREDATEPEPEVLEQADENIQKLTEAINALNATAIALSGKFA